MPSLAPTILEALKLENVRGDMPQNLTHPKPLKLGELMPKLPVLPTFTPPGECHWSAAASLNLCCVKTTAGVACTCQAASAAHLYAAGWVCLLLSELRMHAVPQLGRLSL